LNAAFVEPLLGATLDLPPGRVNGAAWRTNDETASPAATLDVNGARVICVVGAGVNEGIIATCRDLDWVVFGDATARGTLAYFDPLLRDDDFAAAQRPDLVVRMGGIPASKVLAERLREWDTPVVALLGSGAVADPDGLVSRWLEGVPLRDVASMRADSSYATTWFAASNSVGEYLRSLESDHDELNEPMVARSVVELSGENNASLIVGSSMPVRDVEWWAGARRSPTYANRGANGIDGVVSTVLGVCAGAKGIGLLGDLTMLHDVSGFVDGLGAAQGTCVLVVNDNGGGGIFSFLPQAQALGPERFEQLFGTPRHHDLEGVARAFGHRACSVRTRSELRSAVQQALTEPGVSVVVAKVPSRERNVEIHDDLVLSLKNRRSPSR
jgi:2-succinyl-5-enolpyruvyl-6-hydroxy-3-cyclohexene-1-carboxylate synthase